MNKEHSYIKGSIDKKNIAFYKKYGFETCQASEFHLMLLMKDIKASLGI